LSAQAGSRDNLNEPTVLRKRLQGLTANFQENLVMFGLVVLIAHATGVSNDQTALGASLFFYARVAHAVVYPDIVRRQGRGQGRGQGPQNDLFAAIWWLKPRQRIYPYANRKARWLIVHHQVSQ
jgi:hypothetical protein